MDTVATQTRPTTDERFDVPRITGDIDALARKHAGQESEFRAALAQLLKAEMLKARQAAQAVLLKDRHGRRCAETLCFVQDEIIRMLYAFGDQASVSTRRSRPTPSGWRWSRPAAMAAG